jgi:hypothetical protein
MPKDLPSSSSKDTSVIPVKNHDQDDIAPKQFKYNYSFKMKALIWDMVAFSRI